MKRTFAIGDTHGCLDTLQALLDKIAFTTQDELIMLGDYIDRGPDSKGVIDKLMRLNTEGYNVKMLRGNHEQMFLDDYNKETRKSYGIFGNEETLKSFGINSIRQTPTPYLVFMKSLPFYHLTDNYILVHAGLKFRKGQDPLADETNMMWVRDWYADVNRAWLGDRIIVHGHTPQPMEDTEMQLRALWYLPYLNIDCGACFKNKIHQGGGRLCAFDLTNQELFFQENVEEDNFF